MDHAVEDCIRNGLDPYHVIQPINGNLLCDDHESLFLADLDDFEEVAGRLVRQGRWSRVVEHQQFGIRKCAQHSAIARIPFG